MVNEAIRALIANNGGNKKIIAEKLGITPQFLGQLERGERKKPSAELVSRIKEVYKIDILTGKRTETTVSYEENEKASEFERLVAAFENAVSAFSKALDSKESHVQSLERDKGMSVEREKWYQKTINDLTVSLSTLKQA